MQVKEQGFTLRSVTLAGRNLVLMQCYVSFVKMSVTSMYRVTAIRTFIVNSVSFIGIALKRAIVDRRLLIGIIPLFLILYSLFHFAPSVQADEYQDLQNQINDLQHQLELSKNATTPLEGQVKDLNGQLDAIVSRIAVLQKDLQKSEDELSFKKEVLARTVREFYINSFIDVPLLTLFASNDATDTLKQIALQQQSSKENKNVISEISGKISKLADDKRRLAIAQEQVDRQSQFLKGEIAKAKSFQSEVEGKIAALSARQQEIVNAKSGTFTTSVGDVPLADDPNAAPSYNPGFSPAFGGFSFGAYTHRNGMSQYGAKGRADGGANYKDILNHYFPGKEVKEGWGEPGSITVDGYGSVDFQQYLYGIAEMPSSWNKEALKAQAVAARSYALARTNNGQTSICADEGCQVYIGHSKGGDWEAAVNETKGVIVADGGNPVSTQYSSTTGGYLNGSGWDTKCGSKDCWTGDAYEKIAGSPWFYKGWYTQSYSTSSGKCGHDSPWLTGEEMADILNAWLVQGKDGVDGGRITPVTTDCWGGNPYSMSELRDKANSVGGGAATSVGSVSVSYSN
ncbi:MAG TPA: SpoIID/LytB domain-containing protein, partial [Bdellovibrionota bacterium]|nr:SpoIID/LytB domain-containing protein [Bdellovibrionota bacterium]